MSVTTSGASERLDIGQALQDLLRVVLRNIGPFALLGIGLGGVPIGLLSASGDLAEQHPVFILVGLVALIAAFIGRAVLIGAVIFRTARDLDGDPTTLGECLAAGWRRWGAMLGLTIWVGLLMGLGLIFLIVPGIFLALQWAVAGPSLALGARGISDSMDDSARLTKGRRWALLLFYSIFVVVLFVTFLLLALVESAVSLMGSKLLVTVTDAALTNALLDVSFPIAAAVLYRRLRNARDGAPTTALAEVFA
jgi:hypothetical protein